MRTTVQTTPATEVNTAPPTFQAAPDAPCEQHAWCTETGVHGDHVGRLTSLPGTPGAPLTPTKSLLPVLAARLWLDASSSAPELLWDAGGENGVTFTHGDQLRAETARIRGHLARLDALADQFDAIREACEALADASDGPTGAIRRAAAYVAEHGVTPEQARVLGIVARKVIEDGDPDGAGREVAHALTGHFLRLAEGVVHSARIANDSRLSDPTYRVVPADADDWFRYLHQAELATHTAGDGAGDADEAFHQRRILALVQAYAQYWGSGHGRTLKAEYAAQLADAAAFLATEAVTASLAGLETNPHDVADRLHRAIDNAQAVHLAEVGGHSKVKAYADSRFHTAILAAEDAMAETSDPDTTAAGLRAALDMVTDEAIGQDGGQR